MTSKHTPGPWHFGKVDPRFVADEDGSTIADCCALSDLAPSTASICEANARLIAAAPDLLKAVEAMLDAFVDDPLGSGSVGMDRAEDMARDAISKATGD